MLNDRIQHVSRLESALAKADDYISKLPPDTPYSEFEYEYADSRKIDYSCIYLLNFTTNHLKNLCGHAVCMGWVLREVGETLLAVFWR